ncbi:MAG: substrate-binding domain-containing protein [Betaproteobacteria bacterium]
MKLVPTLTWTLDGESVESLDSRLLPLLHAIAESRSLAAAVAKCGISYRAAWGLLRDYRRALGTPLALLERGRGTHVTPSGQRLLDADRTATRRLARILPKLGVEIAADPRGRRGARVASLRVAASHDLALAALADAMPARSGLHLDISFMGSLNAIEEFVAGRADVAGFHVPLNGHPRVDLAPYLQGLNPRHDRLVRFADRDQGLILPRGNPAGLRSLRDVAVNGMRFINRQRGSGTRLLIDQMIADEGIDARSLAGYGKEEFTHPAVAATVASGGADAGFGLRAAAAEYDLAFVPLVRERYYLAVRAKDLAAPPVARLIGLLRRPAFAHMARRLPGYRTTAAGTVVTLEALASAPPAP